MSTNVFISWTRSNGRTEDLAAALGIDAVYVYHPSRFGLIGRYIAQYRMTRRFLREHRPASVILMLPPVPALLAVTRNTSRKTRLVFDLHTGFFYDPKWKWASGFALRLMRDRGTAIVTNQHLADACDDVGVKALVMHDLLKAAGEVLDPKPYLLCPVSYANDEPIAEILSAARTTPEINWKLTGRAPASFSANAPANVDFTGFVSHAEYDRLIGNAAGVVALTTRPHTMQRAGYEAFNVGTAQITSNFPELRDFYGDSVVYSAPKSESIADAARELFAQRPILIERLLELRTQRITEQKDSISSLRKTLGL